MDQTWKWKDFDHFEKIELYYKSNDQSSGFVNYSNKYQTQLKITVRVRPVDKEGNPLPIDPAELQKAARLCVYESDSTFYQDNSTWMLYQQQNISGYHPVLAGKPTNSPDKEAGDIEFDLYVASNGSAFGVINIAVQIDLLSKGYYSTAQGKGTPLCPETFVSAKGIASLWDICEGINNLSISHADTMATKSTIYANGRNQAAVLVSVSATGGGGYYLNLLPEDFMTSGENQYSPARVELVNCHNNSEVLSFKGTKDICYTFTRNEWSRSVGYNMSAKRMRSSMDNGILDIPLYVYSYNASPGKDISVRLTLPGFSVTTAITRTGQWSQFITSMITLSFLEKIDYSDVTKLQIIDGGWNTLDSSVQITSHPNSYKGKSEVQKNGVVKYKQVLIKPNIGSSEVKFLDEKTAINNRAHFNPYSKDRVGMWGNTSAHSSDTYVQALLDYTSETGGHIIAWGVELPETMSKFGFIFTSGSDCQSETNYEEKGRHFMLDIKEDCGKTTWISNLNKVSGAVTLHALSAAHNTDSQYHHTPSWKQNIQPASVSVYDNYGNTGTFRISWDQKTILPSISK
ncbi:hypothetical protein J1782_09635 [Rahnella sp. BCC 1045]|uniref:hypothetical protein n=1 Tax=Rahnella sp. BCC 1045 TaxID=2816251 RepID=UPI001C25CD13|nr:hypothetical protein [Rahnella sp. BCC 1045]MBU9820151.1 hypothetical protein [Rahnella sp. BCC 1045]